MQLGHEPLRVLPEVVDGLAGAILDEHVDAAGLADAGDGGRQERERLRVGQPVELPVHGRDDRVRLELARRPLVVRFELDEVDAVPRARRLRQEAVPGHRVDVMHAGLGLQDLVDLAHDGVRPLHRRGLRELHVHEEEALVLLRHEGRRHDLTETARERREGGEHDERDDDLADQESAARGRSRVCAAVKAAIEPAEEPAEESAARVLRPRTEDERAERGAQRERVERRDQDRERDGERELPVERPGDAGDERGGDEHARQHERDADERAAHLVHRLERRIARGQALLDLRLDRLDHHDRVVDDEADREHEARGATACWSRTPSSGRTRRCRRGTPEW